MDGGLPGTDLTVLLISGTLIMVFLIGIIITSMLIYQKKVLREQQRTQQLELENERSITNAILSTQEEERRRIAQDLHDELGSMIFSLKIKLGEIADNHHDLLGEVEANEQLVDRIGSRVRSIAHDMMPPSLKHRDLGNALKSLAESLSTRAGVVFDVTDNSNELSPDRPIQMTLYRIISEWLNNLVKHSGALHVHLMLAAESDEYSITITDDGKPFDFEAALNQSRGLGLKGILGRLNQIKASYNHHRDDNQNNIFKIVFRLNHLI